MILFGTIVVIGINSLVRSGQDLMIPRNLVVVAVILVFGVGGLSVSAGDFALEGIGLAGLAGVILNLVLPLPTAPTSDEV